MHFYSHHIGDFDRATRHLTRIERSIYRDLMDVYYDTEHPLTLDLSALCRKVIARTNEEVTAVEQVLSDFFTKTPTGWYHDRCEEELDAYRTSNTQKSAAGKASAAKRAAKRLQALNGNPTTVEQPLNERGTALQLTKNQEPRTKNQDKNNPVAPPALSEVSIRGATPDELSDAMRKYGVNSNPTDQRIVQLVNQGVSVATVDAACGEARKSRPHQEVIPPGYVIKIIERWATEARTLNVAGAAPPGQSAPGGYESPRDRERRETVEGLTGSGCNPNNGDADDNPMA